MLSRHTWGTGSLNWPQFILQWFVRLPEFTEFPCHLGKTYCVCRWVFFRLATFLLPQSICYTRTLENCNYIYQGNAIILWLILFEFDHGRSRKTQNRGAVVLGILVRDSKVHFRPLASPIFPLSSLLEVNGPLLTVYVTLGREVVINKHVRALSLSLLWRLACCDFARNKVLEDCWTPVDLLMQLRFMELIPLKTRWRIKILRVQTFIEPSFKG